MSERATAADRPARPSASLTPVQMLLVALFAGLQLVPRLLFASAPHVFSPVDSGVRWALIGTAVVLSQLVWWGLFGIGVWRKGRATVRIALGALSAFFSAVYAVMFGFLAAPAFGFYELRYLASERREMLYAVELVSETGRGGPHAYVDPYGFGRWGLPLSQTDFRAFTSGRFTWQGLVCYRVTELRRGDVIGIVEPSERSTPSGALTRCVRPDPRVVIFDTDRP